jgi:hypothetical protein
MSNPNPVLVAAVPSLLAVIAAIETLVANVGTDPAQFAIKWPGALNVFLGTVEMQLPALASSEIGAVQSVANAKLAAWATSLKALQTQASQEPAAA